AAAPVSRRAPGAPSAAAKTAPAPPRTHRACDAIGPGEEATAAPRVGAARSSEPARESAPETPPKAAARVAAAAAPAARRPRRTAAAARLVVRQRHAIEDQRTLVENGTAGPQAAAAAPATVATLGEAAGERQVVQRQLAQGQLAGQPARHVEQAEVRRALG